MTVNIFFLCSKALKLDSERPSDHPHGSHTQGRQFDTSTTQGKQFDGSAIQGKHCNGSTTQGKWFDGSATQDRPFDSSATQGRPLVVSAMQGRSSDDSITQRRSSDGDGCITQQRPSDGGTTQGRPSDGDAIHMIKAPRYSSYVKQAFQNKFYLYYIKSESVLLSVSLAQKSIVCLGLTSTLKCKHINNHYGILASCSLLKMNQRLLMFY